MRESQHTEWKQSWRDEQPTHNARFVALMDHCLPNWKVRRQQLNRLPVRHTDWDF